MTHSYLTYEGGHGECVMWMYERLKSLTGGRNADSFLLRTLAIFILAFARSRAFSRSLSTVLNKPLVSPIPVHRLLKSVPIAPLKVRRAVEYH